MTMNPEDVQDKRSVIWMGEIPLGEEDKYRYPTDFDIELPSFMMVKIENLLIFNFNLEFEK